MHQRSTSARSSARYVDLAAAFRVAPVDGAVTYDIWMQGAVRSLGLSVAAPGS